MKGMRIISFLTRLALMVTMVLGLVFWIAQLPFLNGFLAILAQIGWTSIHKGFGFTGVFGLLIIGIAAVFIRGSRLLGAAGILYAFLLPAFGLTQVFILVGPLHWVIQAAHLLVGIGGMYLALGIEKRAFRPKQEESGELSSKASTVQVIR